MATVGSGHRAYPALSDDSGGEFRFSDSNDPSQIIFFSKYSEYWLRKKLFEKFGGYDVSVAEIRSYVLEDTPGTKYKALLADLEREGRIEVVGAPSDRRKASFGDLKLKIRFHAVQQPLWSE